MHGKHINRLLKFLRNFAITHSQTSQRCALVSVLRAGIRQLAKLDEKLGMCNCSFTTRLLFYDWMSRLQSFSSDPFASPHSRIELPVSPAPSWFKGPTVNNKFNRSSACSHAAETSFWRPCFCTTFSEQRVAVAFRHTVLPSHPQAP